MRHRIVRRPRVGTLIAALLVAVALSAAQAVSAGAQTGSGPTVSVSSSLNPSTYGQAITFTADVAGLSGLLGQGMVQFQIDGANVGSAEPVTLGGTASYTTQALGGGNHSVTANYTSTGGNGSGSLAGGQVVNQAATTLKLSSSANPAPAGSSIILTATIAVSPPGVGAASGSVSFVSGNTSLGTVNATGGQAYLTVYSGVLPGGTDAITAAYAGNANFKGSSSTLSQAVAGSGPGSPQPTSGTNPTPTPTKSPSPKPTPTKTPSKGPSPSPTPSAPVAVTPTPSFTFVVPTSFPTAVPLAVSPSPSPSASASSSSKLPLVALIVIILVIIVAAVIVTLRRRRLGV